MLHKLKQHKHFPHIFGIAVILLVLLFIFLFSGSAYSGIEFISTHEHIQSFAKAEELRAAMDNRNITKTVLIPSPIETITLNGNSSFTDYQQNIDEILKIAESYPERFIPFCTISPADSKALQIFQDCHARGGRGLKLYNGHSFFYESFGIPLDSPRMKPIYAYAERNNLPILFHVNISNYGEELERVLQAYPDLRVSIPHFMVSSIKIEKVMRILDMYPNTYTDISFGHTPFMAAGFRRMSNDTEKYREFFSNYSDRILFGTDMVLTEIEKKDQDYMEEILECYQNLLEQKTFKCEPVSQYYRDEADKNMDIYVNCPARSGDYCAAKKQRAESFMKWADETEILNGLHLRSGILKKVYGGNPETWLEQK